MSQHTTNPILHTSSDPLRIVHGKRWPAPSDIAGITRYVRQRAATGRCVVCGQPTDAPVVTCKATACLSCWVLGHDEVTI